MINKKLRWFNTILRRKNLAETVNGENPRKRTCRGPTMINRYIKTLIVLVNQNFIICIIILSNSSLQINSQSSQDGNPVFTTQTLKKILYSNWLTQVKSRHRNKMKRRTRMVKNPEKNRVDWVSLEELSSLTIV